MTACDGWRMRVLVLGLGLGMGACAVQEEVPVVATAAVEKPKAVEKSTVVKKLAAAVKPGAITELDLGRLIELRDDGKALLVDVRPGMFYSLGHIPGAESLPKKSFTGRFPGRKADLDAAVAAGKVIVLYCTNAECPDGFAVAQKLAPMGYSVSLYKGGWNEWEAMGFQ